MQENKLQLLEDIESKCNLILTIAKISNIRDAEELYAKRHNAKDILSDSLDHDSQLIVDDILNNIFDDYDAYLSLLKKGE